MIVLDRSTDDRGVLLVVCFCSAVDARAEHDDFREVLRPTTNEFDGDE